MVSESTRPPLAVFLRKTAPVCPERQAVHNRARRHR